MSTSAAAPLNALPSIFLTPPRVTLLSPLPWKALSPITVTAVFVRSTELSEVVPLKASLPMTLSPLACLRSSSRSELASTKDLASMETTDEGM